MGKLTGTRHGDAANELLAFYQDKAHELEQSGQYFMAAIALAFATETAILAYFLNEFFEENGAEFEISDSTNMSKLIEAANECELFDAVGEEVDVFGTPTDILFQFSDGNKTAKTLAKGRG